jgi:sec-independent protein translocase protein TatA
MPSLGWQELVIVLIIIMIIFGAGKLPEIAKSLGQGVKEFRQEASAPIPPATTSTQAPAGSNGAVAAAAEKVEAAAEEVRAEAARAESAARDAI